jgi:hypothetical protein
VKARGAWKLAVLLVVVAAASFILGYYAMVRFIP